MKQLAKLLSRLVERWTSDSPKLFVVITNISIVVSAMAAILLALPISLPAWLVTTLGFLIAFASGFGINSKLTINTNNSNKN